MLDKKEFLSAYRITEEEFLEADIEWSELEAIYEEYSGKIELLRDNSIRSYHYALLLFFSSLLK